MTMVTKKSYTSKKSYTPKAEAEPAAVNEIKRVVVNFTPQKPHAKQRTHQHVVTDGGFVELYGVNLVVGREDIGKTLVIATAANGRGIMEKGEYLNVFDQATVRLEGTGGGYTPKQETPDVEHENLYKETTGKPNSRTFSSTGNGSSSNLSVGLSALREVSELLLNDEAQTIFKTLEAQGYDQETVRTLLISLMIEARRSGK